MDLEDIMLSEVSQNKKRQILDFITYMWNLKNKANKNIYNKTETDLQRQRTSQWLPVGKQKE